jgi:hypothetical protein
LSIKSWYSINHRVIIFLNTLFTILKTSIMKKNKLQLDKFRILSLESPHLIVGGTGGITTGTEPEPTEQTGPTGETGLTGPTGPGGVTGPNTDTFYVTTDPSGDRPTNSSIACNASASIPTGRTTTGG